MAERTLKQGGNRVCATGRGEGPKKRKGSGVVVGQGLDFSIQTLDE